VTSEILTPQAAKKKFDRVSAKIAQLSVVGIAGPGDALADWENTRQSIRLIRAANPQIVFCLSTNGLLLPKYAREIVELGVTHVTVTVNCLDSAIGAQIYKHIHFNGQRYKGEAGAKILIENQLAGIALLTSQGIIVKINIVMLKGINDQHIPDVVKKMRQLGVFMTNIMPLIPAPGSVFEKFPQTAMKDVNEMRNRCELDVMQMRHCKQCRADAIGLLGEDRSHEFRTNPPQFAVLPTIYQYEKEKKIKVAVTSKQGNLVNLLFVMLRNFSFTK
jgi:nitrogen fixation protein NifB